MSTENQSSIGRSANSIGSKLLQLAAPARGEKTNVIVERSARLSGLSYWRAYNIIYGKARRIDQAEVDAINAALDKKRREAARNELHDLKLRILALESRLRQTDAAFHEPTTDFLGDVVQGTGRPIPGRG